MTRLHIPEIALLSITTFAATGMLMLDAIGSGWLTWAQLVFPITLALGVVRSAHQAWLRGERDSASALLILGAFGNAAIAAVVS